MPFFELLDWISIIILGEALYTRMRKVGERIYRHFSAGGRGAQGGNVMVMDCLESLFCFSPKMAGIAEMYTST